MLSVREKLLLKSGDLFKGGAISPYHTRNRTVVDEQDALNIPITEIDGSPPKPSTKTGRQRHSRAVAGPSTKPKLNQH
jgi:hypothetical protein